MKILFFLFVCIFHVTILAAQQLITPYENSKGTETTTYEACISFYKKLAKQYPQVTLKKMGKTDAGYPLHLVVYEKNDNTNIRPKLTILINNGIHAGEPDGVDASMLFLRDIVTGKIAFPSQLRLAIIPFYNIGGALNRGSYSRVNQEGPLAYGFRGNAQNLDLNRDFTKCDSENAKSFAAIFHWLKPHILLDTHVSDGADFQHT
ncbi:MAG: M14 family zinc carboxypeptidase, partial [Chitinophagaceae bacterium]